MFPMRRAFVRAAVLFAAVFCNGCATTAFTVSYKREHALREEDLKRMHFRTSGELVLQRSTAQREQNSAEGAFRASASAMVQEIVIPKDTPLVVMKVVSAPDGDAEYLQLALSTNAPGKSLWFSTLRPRRTGHYELTPVTQLDENAKPVLAGTPVVRYDGFDYRLRDEGMWQVFLCVGEVLRAHAHASASTETPRK